MATESRPRRANAGKNIGSLITQETGAGDDFYSTVYGGFSEESEDEEYETEASEDDQVDSDFDVDETEWGPDEGAEDKIRKEEKRRTKQWVKPFRQPAPFRSSSQPLKPPKPKKRRSTAPTSSMDLTITSEGGRTFRKSTQEISRGFRKRQEEEEEMKRWRPVRRLRQPKRQMTHEEKLEEAKWTELENLASLEAYTRTMAEKKKVKTKRVVFHGPVVRYLSVSMPLVQEVDPTDDSMKGAAAVVEKSGTELEKGVKEGASLTEVGATSQEGAAIPPPPPPANSGPETMETNVAMETGETDDKNKNTVAADDTPTSPKPHPPSQPLQKQSRNFMIFTDTNNFPSAYFPKTRPTRPRRKLCPVTGLPAKYVDPLTRTPYATPFAFKVIRMRYVSEAEEKCEQRLIQLSNWLEEKKKKKMETT